MSLGSQTRKRADRVAALELPPGFFARAWDIATRSEVQVRLAICVATALVMWLVTFGWAPPFPFRIGYTPPRGIAARVEFQEEDKKATADKKERARREIRCVYINDPDPIDNLRGLLRKKVLDVVRAESFDKLDKDLWAEFQLPVAMGATKPESPEPSEDAGEAGFLLFRQALEMDMGLAKFEQAVKRSLDPWVESGLLVKLQHDENKGSMNDIDVGRGKERYKKFDVRDVQVDNVAPKIIPSVEKEFSELMTDSAKRTMLAKRVGNWLSNRLPNTLTFDLNETLKAADAAEKAVPDQKIPHKVGSLLVPGGEPLSAADLKLLHLEYSASLERTTVYDMMVYSAANFGMYLALYVLCGFYVHYHHPQLIANFRHFATLNGLAVAAVAVAAMVSLLKFNQWRVELIPLLLFGMTVTLVFQRELALLLSACLGLIIAVSLGQDLEEFTVLVASTSAAILLMGRIRSRTRLLYVGMWAGAVATLTALGIGTLEGQPLVVRGDESEGPIHGLLIDSIWCGFWAIVSGFLMTGLLPFIERLFDVQTEMQLLELGDIAHPLLQELVRRAPGTYNHSINVASIAEAAAEAIGANGLLVRVGAYFHDIGKMFKPSYFVENQGSENIHESLQPAMSKLVIIAHVKDGADLARQHNLPQPIIDFIEQHHGTTLVEYFYREAIRDSEENPDAGEVDESSYRYPGPKPQTKEAAVLMLSDAVEGACRALVDPTPARIEGRVADICMKRLLDGQFDECDLSLQELHTIQTSLVKSLTAVYHGRVKYPDQQPAER